MEINAVLSLAADGAEDPYVRTTHHPGQRSRVLKGESLGRKAVSHPPLSRVLEPG
jgi:hypothetical protein